MSETKTFDIDSIPDDAVVNNAPGADYKPFENGENYQVEINEIKLAQNSFYKEGEKGQSKYQFDFTFVVLNEGEYLGRRLWKSASPSMLAVTKKTGKPSILCQIVNKALKKDFTWDDCKLFTQDDMGLPSMKVLYGNLLNKIQGQQIRVNLAVNKNPETGKIKTEIVNYLTASTVLPKYVKEENKEEDKTNKNIEEVNVDEVPF